MFNPFIWLDNLLLTATQKLCDIVQNVTGLTKFRLEKWLLIIITLFVGMGYLFRVPAPASAFFAFFVAWTIFGVRRLEKQEAEFLKNGKLEKPQFEICGRLYWLFIFSLIAGVLSSFEDPISSLGVYPCICFILFAYLDGCVPRPPGKSKMREWGENLLWWLSGLVQPAHRLVPVRK